MPGTEVAIPGIGSLVNLDHPDEVARALADIRELENMLREAKRELTFVLERESEKQGTKTLGYGDVTVTVTTPTEIAWDLNVLEELLEAGLPQERYDELVKTEISYKVSAREADRIAGANATYADIIDRARTNHAGTPRVSVKR